MAPPPLSTRQGAPGGTSRRCDRRRLRELAREAASPPSREVARPPSSTDGSAAAPLASSAATKSTSGCRAGGKFAGTRVTEPTGTPATLPRGLQHEQHPLHSCMHHHRALPLRLLRAERSSDMIFLPARSRRQERVRLYASRRHAGRGRSGPARFSPGTGCASPSFAASRRRGLVGSLWSTAASSPARLSAHHTTEGTH